MTQHNNSTNRFHPDEWQLRVDLAACYRLVALYGWSDLVFTHISAKLPPSVAGEEHQFLINPYGLMFDEITASSLVKIDMHCNKLDEDNPHPVNPAGFVIHSAVHEARPDAGCVLHTHTHAPALLSALNNMACCPSANKARLFWHLWLITTMKGLPFATMRKPGYKQI